jgi:hypothetical protein
MGVFKFSKLCVVALLTTGLFSSVHAQSPKSEGVSAVFGLQDEVATFEPQSGKLSIVTVEGGSLRERVSVNVPGNVWQVTASPTQYLVATGMGRTALDAPVRVLSFTKDLKSSREVFSFSSERAEVPFLKWLSAKGAPSKAGIAFFESKYVTKIGFLSPSEDAPWRFEEVSSLRMGTAVDAHGKLIVVGRPYGDIQGQDGDLALLKDGMRELLPSYRGVRAVRLVGDPDDPSIFVADGWHQNYGQLAQGRVSLLRKDPQTKKYALQIVDKDDAQYGFSKFVDFMIDGKRHVAALGPKQLVIYGPEDIWKRTVVYSRAQEDSMMDMALVKSEENRAWFVVVDKGLQLVSYP